MNKALRFAAVCLTVSVATVFAASCAVTGGGHSHSYGEWREVKEATCTDNGLEEQECSCGDKKTRPIPQKGHSSDKWLVGENSHYKVCSVCGNEFGEEQHSIKDGECTVCNYKEATPATLTYALNDDGTGYNVTGGAGEMVVIPAEHEGLPVVGIANQAFDKSGIVSVEFPSSLTHIGRYAFSECAALKKVTLPATIQTMGDWAFYESGVTQAEVNCNTGKGAFRGCASLESVTFGENVTQIGEQAFFQCASLSEVEIPQTVVGCGASAFQESGLKKVTVGGDLLGGAVIDNKYIFHKCDNLEEAVFTETAARLSYYAFDSCASLKRYVLQPAYPHFKSVDGIIYTNDLKECVKAPHGITGAVEIPEGCEKLSGEQPFRNCKNLTSVKLPSTLTEIANSSFNGSGITSLTIGDGVKTLGAALFAGCSELASIHIGAGVETIGNKAFANCPKLTDITVSADNPKYKSINNGVVSGYGTDFCYLVIANRQNEIPDCVTHLGDYVFSCREMTSITIPSGVKVIGRGAFEYCDYLESVNLPSTLLSIEPYAFDGCWAIGSISLPANLTYIGMHAFDGCDDLASVSFAEASGWKATPNGASSSSAVSLTLTNAATNAEYLKVTYSNHNWRR